MDDEDMQLYGPPGGGYGVRLGPVILLLGFCPKQVLVGLAFNDGLVMAHFGPFLIGVLWGTD